jgi:uncharacterized protein YlxW (UPF0749 family)
MTRELGEAEAIYGKYRASYMQEVEELGKLEATPITSDFDSMMEYFKALHANCRWLLHFHTKMVQADKDVQAVRAAEAEAAAVEAAEAAKLTKRVEDMKIAQADIKAAEADIKAAEAEAAAVEAAEAEAEAEATAVGFQRLLATELGIVGSILLYLVVAFS